MGMVHGCIITVQQDSAQIISGFSGVACGYTEYFNLWNGLTVYRLEKI